MKLPTTPPPTYDLILGLDRSDAKADVYTLHPATGQSWSETIATTPETLTAWLAGLRQDYPQARAALCLEQPAGNLIAFLEPYAWLTLYPINPLTLQKFREAFVTSRAKDDSLDAVFLAELVRTHADKLTPWQPEDSATRLLQQLVAHRRAVVDERTALSNRLKALLKQYFPQALDLAGDELWRPLGTAFLLKWPSLQAVQKVPPATLQQFYYRHGSRSPKLIAQRLDLIAAAVPLTDEPALVQSFAQRVQLIGHQLQQVVRAIKAYERQIAAAFLDHPDYALFKHLPGAGPVLAPRLLASLGSQRERYASARAVQRFSGIAPVTKQSGNKRHVHRRYLCPKFCRQGFHEFAKESIFFCRWAAAYYWQQRERGATHHVAVRALAYKWQRIIWRCWQDRVPYDDARYEAALARHHSPLVPRLKHIELGKNPWTQVQKKAADKAPKNKPKKS